MVSASTPKSAGSEFESCHGPLIGYVSLLLNSFFMTDFSLTHTHPRSHSQTHSHTLTHSTSTLSITHSLTLSLFIYLLIIKVTLRLNYYSIHYFFLYNVNLWTFLPPVSFNSCFSPIFLTLSPHF